MAKLNKDMQSKILNYKDEIKTIASFVEAVRKTVGQYLGSRGNKGHLNMIRELGQNSFDEMEKVDSPCNEIWFIYDENTLEFTCKDNGRGLPFGEMIRIFSSQHTSSNYVKKAREFSSGRHGVGSKVTNACSSTFKASSYLFTGEGRHVEFIDGKPWSKGEISIPNKDNYQGSVVSFIPDLEVMEEVTSTCEDVLRLLVKLFMLTTPGVGNKMHFYGITKSGKVRQEDYENVDGIISFLVIKTQNPVIPPIVVSDICDTMKCNIAFTYDSSDLGADEDVMSFANMCPTVNGESTHVRGFMDSLCNYFRNYMNKIYLHNSKTKVIGSDIKGGLKAVVTVSHIEPDFSGQAKEIFTNPDVIPYIATVLEATLNEWTKTHSNELQRLCKHFKDVADLRMSEDNNRVNFIKRVKNVSALSNLPAKLVKAEGKNHLEFIIVEGDSAMSPAIRGRDPMKQAIFPIRGKIINAITNSREKVLQNEEVCGITAILGGGIGKNFDISKCKYDKIIFMADADFDGYHIRELLMKLFLIYFRPLIKEGRVYIAVPPLYSIKEGKKTRFFVDKVDYVKYLQASFSKSYTVCTDAKCKTELSTKELNAILFKNEKYVESLNVTATNYAIHPQLLEYLIRYRTMPVSWFKKFIKSKWRFLTVEVKDGIMVFDGLIGEQYYTVVCNQRLLNACQHLFGYVDNSFETYYMNGVPSTLLDLMTAFSKFKPKGIQRYKGLGEMPVKDLKYSTLHPDGERTLLRITVEDINRQIEEIRAVQSDISGLLKTIDMAEYNI